MFLVALLRIIKKRKLPTYPSMSKWINKLCDTSLQWMLLSKAKQSKTKNGAVGAGSIDTPNNLDESQRLYAE